MNINDLTYQVIGCAYKVHNVLGQVFSKRFTRTPLSWNSRSWAFMRDNK
jgi:hypothetical protein